MPSQHILPLRRNALSVSFWRTLTVSTRRVVTARTSATATTSSPPATGHFSQAAGMQSARLLHSTGWTQVHFREEYLGLRRLKHESNKKFLGMSSEVPPFALSPDQLAPSSRYAKPPNSREKKKQGGCGSEKGVPFFLQRCNDGKKTNRKQPSKCPFMLDTFVTSAMNGITISNCREHTHTHTEILTWLRACGRNLIRSSPDVSF